MEAPLFVRSFECFAHLPRDGQCVGNRDRTARDMVGERRPLDQFHHEGLHTTSIFQPVNRGDIVVVQRSERTGLALKARQSIAVLCEGFGQHLDRDIALKSPVSGAIHFPHAADSDLDGDFIGAESRPRGQGHLRGADYRRRVGR